MSIITTKEIIAEKNRFKRASKLWADLLWLNDWEIDVSYTITPIESRDPSDKERGHCTLATCDVKWFYKKAFINVYLVQTMLLSDKDLEKLVLHELLHAVVNEMRNINQSDGIEHEERVVTTLTDIMYLLQHPKSRKNKKTAWSDKGKKKKTK